MSGASLTPEQLARFVRVLRETGNVGVSAAAIGVRRETLKRRRDNDAEFAELWAEAAEDAADALEAEARRRAVEGVTRIRAIGKGETFERIEEQHYSDALLIKLMEANNPEKFTNRSKTEISNPDGSMQLGDTELAAKLTSLLAAAEARMKQGV